VSAALLLVAAVAAEAVAFEREIAVPGPGAVAVVLDAPVYESARLDLGDVRVIDEQGADVPSLLRRFVPERRPEPWQPPLLNRSDQPGRSTRATLDLGSRAPRQALELELSGDNFRRRVRVEASDDGESWRTLTDDAWVFAVPGPPAARFETVRFPVNDQRHLRVTVFHGEDETGRVRLRAARVVPVPGPRQRERWIEPRASRSEHDESSETRVVVELEARHLPVSGIALDVADPRFFRRVVVEARREPLPARGVRSAPSLRWVALDSGDLHRQRDPEGRLVAEKLRVDVAGRARVLRLRIQNRDDAPLAISRVRVAVPEERLVFAAAPDRRYRLRYGEHGLRAREWDLARSVADLEAWVAGARVAELGPPAAAATPEPAPIPWSERHPGALLAVLLLVVAGLGALTWKALRTAP
jgi:hypothetical protein